MKGTLNRLTHFYSAKHALIVAISLIAFTLSVSAYAASAPSISAHFLINGHLI